MTIFTGFCPNCEKWAFMKGDTKCPKCGWPNKKKMDAYNKKQTDSTKMVNKGQPVLLRLEK